MLQFYGMELNMPAMDHHTLIIPHSEREASMLSDIESRFDSQEAWPRDPSRNTGGAGAARARTHEEPAAAAVDVCQSSVAIGDRCGRLRVDEPRELRSQQQSRARGVPRHGRARPAIRPARLHGTARRRRTLRASPAGHRGGYGNEGARTSAASTR